MSSNSIKIGLAYPGGSSASPLVIFCSLTSRKPIKKYSLQTMKLTDDIIEGAPIVINPDKQLTLQLRSLGLTEIEALPTNFEAIDLTNNQLIEISLTSAIPGIKTLILNNNDEFYILDSTKFPRLLNLSVINCNLKIRDIKAWAFPKLEHLLIFDNPVTSVENFRLIMIHLIPCLLTLNCEKVKAEERTQLIELFNTHTIDDFIGKIDQDSKETLIEKLKNATDIEEIERLEKLLAT